MLHPGVQYASLPLHHLQRKAPAASVPSRGLLLAVVMVLDWHCDLRCAAVVRARHDWDQSLPCSLLQEASKTR